MKELLARQREEIRAKLSAERRPDPSGGEYLFDREGRRWAWTGTFRDLETKP